MVNATVYSGKKKKKNNTKTSNHLYKDKNSGNIRKN